SYAILRHFARQLGAYDGETEDEKYWADAMCDIVLDCTFTPKDTLPETPLPTPVSPHTVAKHYHAFMAPAGTEKESRKKRTN
ncbi:hypothetical protein LTR16_012639, partial [Cryomyces antarcticus]